jgi:short-subunit dehydrogenase
MKPTAIITGASSGLGKEFVDATIDKFPDIDHIWLIARRESRLKSIAQKYPHKHFVILPLDLTQKESFAALAGKLKSFRPDIKLLINDAGMLGKGPFQSVGLDVQQKMIDLNVTAPVTIIKLALPYMRKGSMIVNVCSVSGFAPVINQIVYSSTKVFLINFTRGLRNELHHDGIKLLALCPGNMATEMMAKPDSSKKRKTIIDRLPFLQLGKMTRRALTLVQRGRSVYTPGGFYKFYRVVAKLLPHDLLMHFAKD